MISEGVDLQMKLKNWLINSIIFYTDSLANLSSVAPLHVVNNIYNKPLLYHVHTPTVPVFKMKADLGDTSHYSKKRT